MNTEPTVFKPPALTRKLQPNVAHIVCEARITRDLTMPELDWSSFDEPTYLRRKRQEMNDERRG